MEKIKTKEAYLKSIRQVSKTTYHTANQINKERKATDSNDSTPEGYTITDIEKQSQKSAYAAGRWLKNQSIKIKKKQSVSRADKTIKRKEQMIRMAKLSLQKAVWLTKTTAKAVVRITKITISAAKAFIAFLMEGGWIPLTVILSILLIICMICSFGTVFGDNDVTPESDIQVVAYSQIGNIGGVPYWSWYGYSNRVEWCACFVSWCANQCGYIKNNTFPKYAACIDGVEWFKKEKQWIDGNVVPISGMIIFFDWEQDGLSDHTGIVHRVENGVIYTIEGNSNDSVKINQYPIEDHQILGYGVPAYITQKDAIP